LFTQTIALFRYQLLGIINARMLWLLIAIIAVAFMGSRFVAELAIINSEAIALAFMADFLRYSLTLLLIITICYRVSQDYELNQFERLISMPINRWQYVLAQLLMLMVLTLFLLLPVLILMIVVNGDSPAIYWFLALFLEMMLAGQLALLAIVTLEKLPVAVIFTVAFYLLAKASPIIDLILAKTVIYNDEETGYQLTDTLFLFIQFILPDPSAFAQNNLLFALSDMAKALWSQLISVAVYSLFIQSVILIDFYRKEFNR